MVTKFPQIIKQALAKLDNLISSEFFRRGRSKGWKAMKYDHAENLKALLVAMLYSCCMQFDGSLCRVSGNTARPLTVPEMAQFSKLKQRTAERCLADLKDLGLIQSEKQFKRFLPTGLKVAAVWRVFTKLFWEKLGLWSLFVESVKYAQEHSKLNLKLPLKAVTDNALGALMKKTKQRTLFSEEKRRECQRQNALFRQMTQCRHFANAKNCPGGHQVEEICAMCRKLA